MMKRMDLSQIIRSARVRAGLTQRALAKRLKVAQSAVGQWETDVTKPSILNRVDLANVLNLKFSDLIPEAADVATVVSEDPQVIILVRKFEGLPASVREAILMQVVATADSLEARADQPRRPAKK
jgi:transcriptional regulator with XRE-family HTH domain